MLSQEYYPYVLLGDADLKTLLERLQEVIQPFWAGWFSDKQPIELQIKSCNQQLNVNANQWDLVSNTVNAWVAIEHADKLNEFFMGQLTGIPRRKVSETSSIISSLYERFLVDFKKTIFGSIGQVVLVGTHAITQSKGCGAVIIKVTLSNKQVFNLALGADFIKHFLPERFAQKEMSSRLAMSFDNQLFHHLTVNVEVVAGSLKLPLQEVKEFEIGQVLKLDKKISEPFSLTYGQRPIDDVQYGRQGGRKVFQLLIK
ncbi:FliM/FliN family flagellar motor C-terminal domain-containing protein [Methylophilus methylotrophus]|uniref:FliM/FliN family flagellar motor C-terminal domain-containing protein n=1 Tax=Methylophilus methylotrophus TaxID=17 RepID=UPI000F5B3F06|nr:FliM/FliN family flagellar motor C-terminal domain-containing protein [Methylophilus methylotrophus]